MNHSPAAKPDSEEVIVQAYAAYMQALAVSGRGPAKQAGQEHSQEQEQELTQALSQMVGVAGFDPAASASRATP